MLNEEDPSLEICLCRENPASLCKERNSDEQTQYTCHRGRSFLLNCTGTNERDQFTWTTTVWHPSVIMQTYFVARDSVGRWKVPIQLLLVVKHWLGRPYLTNGLAWHLKALHHNASLKWHRIHQSSQLHAYSTRIRIFSPFVFLHSPLLLWSSYPFVMHLWQWWNKDTHLLRIPPPNVTVARWCPWGPR